MLQPTQSVTQTTITQEQPSPATVQVDETVGWKTYTNTKYNYTLRYPSEWEPATCSYAATETGVMKDLILEELDNVEFHRIGWDCPPTDAPWPNFGIYVKDDEPTEPQFFPPVYDRTDRAIEQKPDKQIGNKSYFVYWIVKKEPSPGLDNQIMYYLKNNGKIYSFQVSNKDDISTLEKILSSLKFQ
ncbi:hypothetical protein A3H80_03055 [Candidatus Roizmanbacteria bacterium RIFCSPLOWO2_02_FULL_37_19]|uniref:DUF4367 domain-containing protein n=1 Tax=Candidatus Roizmanbacteria bacterium RIFCSPHIGHO2_02_FULL_37_24 TaxID=1802037 RepID=A0A1F7GYU7_9BACT|nr:MAG: hypothetical protein A2862_00260 [Candidatus Roizmanbacteria bacterium RIFCSPHIGHO2_01_FULL_38_41]OGK24023.1 MAG: hypothetical protein A3C24_02955 [Candidatus Roizmanbacteria bacterium RIFCSPHIGHO2_02_FULL_37_24]OGK32363.1 MAG: hypothetical protein A3E10_04235 [Candidatus Roizmanbacteria bacterium RIFCSPHIGHO2_12_FULL_37_23]OGK44689.1 MAG: hypothetical protein A2956_00985 [Candidatus Roizmanbacteria bacterium RIFCSPLOWO2_01_FULL_37_57]OGK53747.1 MAG: hypothetical protein A3H80_03055 [Ca